MEKMGNNILDFLINLKQKALLNYIEKLKEQLQQRDEVLNEIREYVNHADAWEWDSVAFEIITKKIDKVLGERR